jgi:hypothetical protein
MASSCSGGETSRGQHGLAVGFLNAEHDIAAAQVPEIIRKRTDRTHNGRGVPSLFEFKALTFHGVSVEEFWE